MGLLIGGVGLRQVVVVGDFLAGFSEHGGTLGEGYARASAFRDLEVAGVGVFALDDFDFVGVAAFELAEDEDEQVFAKVHHFMVVLLDFHFEVKTGELGREGLVMEWIIGMEGGGSLWGELHVDVPP